jgi:hypothetical protein
MSVPLAWPFRLLAKGDASQPRDPLSDVVCFPYAEADAGVGTPPSLILPTAPHRPRSISLTGLQPHGQRDRER